MPDIIGFGHSDKPDILYSLDLANDFLNNLIEKFSFNKISLIGNSMGGLISLYFTITFQEKVEKLILVNNGGFSQELSPILKIATIYPIGEIALAFANYKTVYWLLRSLFYDKSKIPTELIYKVLEILKFENSKKILLRVLRYGVNLKGLNPGIIEFILNKISGIKIPTLIIWGEEDKIIPSSSAKLGNKLIKNSKLHIFKGCGHLPQIECKNKFNQLVLDFLLE